MDIKNYRLIITCALGTLLEWFDYVFYAYIATTLANIFFPQLQSQNAILATFSVFAAGFIMRPLGAVLFGHIGDKYGRKTALVIALILMGVASLGVGLTPSYLTIGIYAPLLLIFFRLLQGLSVASEHTGAAIFLIEHTTNKRQALTSSWIACAAALGIVIGAAVAALITHYGSINWLWRVPFIIGGFTALIGLYLRIELTESPSFLQVLHLQHISRSPLWDILKKHRISLLQAFIVTGFIGIDVYICNLYFVTFGINYTRLDKFEVTLLAGLGELCVAFFIPVMALMADYIGERSIIMIGLIGAAITAPVVFLLLLTNSFALALLGQIMYAIFNAAVSGGIFKYLFYLFPTKVRYTGCAVSWSINAALFAGTAPLIAEYFTEKYHLLNAGPLYVTFTALLTLILIISLDKKQTTQAIHST